MDTSTSGILRGPVTAAVVVGALATAAIGLVSLLAPGILAPQGSAVTTSTRLYADYLAARNLPLAVLLVGMLIAGQRRVLAWLMLLTGLTQALDAVIGAATGRLGLAWGPTIFALVYFACAWWLLRSERARGQ